MDGLGYIPPGERLSLGVPAQCSPRRAGPVPARRWPCAGPVFALCPPGAGPVFARCPPRALRNTINTCRRWGNVWRIMGGSHSADSKTGWEEKAVSDKENKDRMTKYLRNWERKRRRRAAKKRKAAASGNPTPPTSTLRCTLRLGPRLGPT